MDHFSISSWCANEKWILYSNWLWIALWLDQEETSNHFPKPNMHPKRAWSLFVGLLPVWPTTAFWVPEKPSRLRSVLRKLMRCMKTRMPAAGIGQQKGPNSPRQHSNAHHTTNACFKSWTNWASECCLICHIHLTSRQPTTISSSISTTLCRENASTTSRRQKMLSKSSSNPEAWIFTLQE